MHLKNGKKLYNERGITFFHETERYVNKLNIYNRSKNGTNLWDDLIEYCINTTTKFKLNHVLALTRSPYNRTFEEQSVRIARYTF